MCFNILFFWKRKLSSIIFVKMTLCQSAILVTQKIMNIFSVRYPVLISWKQNFYVYLLYIPSSKNKTTEFRSNCYIWPAASYAMINFSAFFFLGFQLVFKNSTLPCFQEIWHQNQPVSHWPLYAFPIKDLLEQPIEPWKVHHNFISSPFQSGDSLANFLR